MATNHTTNYQLNQWEATDQVRRTDFNEDNAKIDAALEANAQAIAAETEARTQAVTALANRSRFTKLGEIYLASNSNPVESDLSTVNWSEWDRIHLDMLISNTGSRLMYFNDVSDDSNRFFSFGSGISKEFWQPRLTFDVGFTGNRTVSINRSSLVGVPLLSYNQVKKILITGGVYAGSQIIWWGEK